MQRAGLVFKILGLLLVLFSANYALPLLVSLIYQDGQASVFVYSFLLTFSLGALIWMPCARHTGELRARDGFLITVLFWLVLSAVASLPFLLSDQPDLSLIDATFESVSGLTTTGATLITGLDQLPESLLFYRQLLQWLGGIGLVVIAVAILPMLGVGGMQLYRAETPGPVKDSKLTPRIAETAKALFLIYLALTLACALAYWLAGMSMFDAIAHSFSTVSIGGFSTHDQSMGWFIENPGINGDLIITICVVFMVISGFNFALHYYSIARLTLGHYLRDSEAKTYLLILLCGVLAVSLGLYLWGYYNLEESFRQGLFQTISIATTTGFSTDDFANWPQHITFLLFFLSFVGACAGSTGGGMKIGRMMILAKQMLREIARLIHPNAVIPIKIGARPVNPRITDSIWGFLGAYLIIFHGMVILLLATGLDFLTAWSAVASGLNNLGPGLGQVAENYGDISGFAKLILCSSMILGRLELFTLIVIMSPMYWRS